MEYDFIEVGTANFDTLAEKAKNKRGLSVEPLRELLEPVMAGKNVSKVFAAIGEKLGSDFIFFVPKETIQKHNLPAWVEASSAFGKINPNIVRELEERKLSLDLVQKREVQVVSWADLFITNQVTYVSYVKIDAEGMDLNLVTWLFDFLESSCIPFPAKLQFETREEMTDQKQLESVTARLNKLGYKVKKVGDDTQAQL